MKRIYCLLKILDEREHAESFARGCIKLGSLKSYIEYEDSHGGMRGDQFEGLSQWLHPDRTEIEIAGHKLNPDDIVGPVALQDSRVLEQHALCLYAITNGDWDQISDDQVDRFKASLAIHRSNFGLGQYCVVITNSQEFIARIETALREQCYRIARGLVEYFDEHEFHGSLDAGKVGFYKRSVYEVQSEYRFLVDSDVSAESPFWLEVGDLSDITMIMTPEEFNENLEVNFHAQQGHAADAPSSRG